MSRPRIVLIPCRSFSGRGVAVRVVVVLLLAGGCGDSTGGRQEISGTVILKGRPLDEGFIEFHPLGNFSPNDRKRAASGFSGR